jgi:hypothetical protein
VEIQAELLAFDLRERKADFDIAEDATATFGIALSLRA